MYIPTISSFSLLTLPILNGLAKASFIAAHAQVTAAPQYNSLRARQDFYYTCETGYTSCIGWEDACCPQGAACTVISGQRGCDAECNGVEICGHLCCDSGYQCSANSVCVKDVYTINVPSDSVTVSVPAETTSSGSSSQSESDGIFTILPWSTTTDETSVTPTASSTLLSTSSSVASSSHARSSSSVAGGTTPPVTGAGVSSSSGATTPASSTKPVQTGGASAAPALDRSSVLVWMLALFLGIAL